MCHNGEMWSLASSYLRKNKAFISHVLALTLAVDALFWLLFTLLYNVPFESSPLSATAAGRWWFLRVQSGDGAGATQYGFGVLGYCVWSGGDSLSPARCVRKVAWKPEGLDLDLPSSFDHFSITAILLLFPIFNSLILSSNLIWMLCSPLETPSELGTGVPPILKKKGQSLKTFTVLQHRNVWFMAFQAVGAVGGYLPPIIYAVVVVVNTDHATFASGWAMTLAAMLVNVAAIALVLFGGFRYQKNKSSRFHMMELEDVEAR